LIITRPEHFPRETSEGSRASDILSELARYGIEVLEEPRAERDKEFFDTRAVLENDRRWM
jgi:hypothetical protein